MTSIARSPRLVGRRALVTGAGRGLGRAIALALAAEGACVAVNDRDHAPGTRVAEEIEGAGGTAIALAAAIDDHGAARCLITEAAAALGGLDVLINNAGIASSGHRIELTPVEEVEQLLAVHAVAPFVLSQAALPHLRSAGRGDIVMISSIATDSHGPNAAPYNMAKAAMESLAYTLAKEEKRNGILVNVVAPAVFDTRLGREVTERLASARRRRSGEPHFEIQSLADPAIVADVIVGIISSKTPSTGERIRVIR